MRLKRHLEVNLVRDNKSTDNLTEPSTIFEDRVQLVHETTLDVGKKVLIAAVIYVAADTLRQVLVKATPSK